MNDKESLKIELNNIKNEIRILNNKVNEIEKHLNNENFSFKQQKTTIKENNKTTKNSMNIPNLTTHIFGILASILIFVACFLFITTFWNVIPNIYKTFLLILFGFILLVISYLLIKNNKSIFLYSLSSCGLGIIYFGIIAGNLIWNCISIYIVLLFLSIWSFLCLFLLKKFKSKLYYYIVHFGLFMCYLLILNNLNISTLFIFSLIINLTLQLFICYFYKNIYKYINFFSFFIFSMQLIFLIIKNYDKIYYLYKNSILQCNFYLILCFLSIFFYFILIFLSNYFENKNDYFYYIKKIILIILICYFYGLIYQITDLIWNNELFNLFILFIGILNIFIYERNKNLVIIFSTPYTMVFSYFLCKFIGFQKPSIFLSFYLIFTLFFSKNKNYYLKIWSEITFILSFIYFIFLTIFYNLLTNYNDKLLIISLFISIIVYNIYYIYINKFDFIKMNISKILIFISSLLFFNTLHNEYYIFYIICLFIFMTILEILEYKTKNNKLDEKKNTNIFIFNLNEIFDFLFNLFTLNYLNCKNNINLVIMFIIVLICKSLYKILKKQDIKQYIVMIFLMFNIINVFQILKYSILGKYIIACSLICIIYCVFTIFLGFIFKKTELRKIGIIFIIAFILKMLILDITTTNSMIRVFCLLCSGIICFVISYTYEKIENKYK